MANLLMILLGLNMHPEKLTFYMEVGLGNIPSEKKLNLAKMGRNYLGLKFIDLNNYLDPEEDREE